MTLHITQWDVPTTKKHLTELRPLLDAAYPNSHMYQSLKRDLDLPLPFFAGLVALTDDHIQGFIAVQEKIHPDVEYCTLPPLHIQRFTVSESSRGQQIGTRLLERAKTIAQENGYVALFGQSNESGALRLYGKAGALFSRTYIEQKLSDRNGPTDNEEIFRLMLTHKSLRNWRYPIGNGVPFVFCLDPTTEPLLAAKGYLNVEKNLAK